VIVNMHACSDEREPFMFVLFFWLDNCQDTRTK
jgi:hypothetical protein